MWGVLEVLEANPVDDLVSNSRKFLIFQSESGKNLEIQLE